MKTFNTTGACVPEKHYMVDLSSRLITFQYYFASAGGHGHGIEEHANVIYA